MNVVREKLKAFTDEKLIELISSLSSDYYHELIHELVEEAHTKDSGLQQIGYLTISVEIYKEATRRWINSLCE